MGYSLNHTNAPGDTVTTSIGYGYPTSSIDE